MRAPLLLRKIVRWGLPWIIQGDPVSSQGSLQGEEGDKENER